MHSTASIILPGINVKCDKKIENLPKLDNKNTTELKKSPEHNLQIVWQNVIIFILLHSIAGYGLYYIITERKFLQLVFANLLAMVLGLGITAGAHRLWSHKAYKATLPLKIILLFLQTSTLQNSVYTWVRDHRLHHKFTDTDSDPHNSKRGLFFSHMGWLLVRKHPEVKNKVNVIDMSDIKADKMLMVQHKYYIPLALLCSFALPIYLWRIIFNEPWFACIAIGGAYRYVYSLHCTWTINSLAHYIGMKPYDKNISATESGTISFLSVGEGWHNYHHVFPNDYKTPDFELINLTIRFIQLCEKLGLAYDLKTVSPEMVKRRMQRTGSMNDKPENDY